MNEWTDEKTLGGNTYDCCIRIRTDLYTITVNCQAREVSEIASCKTSGPTWWLFSQRSVSSEDVLDWRRSRPTCQHRIQSYIQTGIVHRTYTEPESMTSAPRRLIRPDVVWRPPATCDEYRGLMLLIEVDRIIFTRIGCLFMSD